MIVSRSHPRALCFAPLVLLAACQAETSSPAIADHFEVEQGAGQTGAPARPLDSLVLLRLIDDHGAPMAGVPVTWSVVEGGGSIVPIAAATDEQGRIGANWTLGPSVGTQRVTVLAEALPSFPLTAEARGLEAVDIAVARFAVCALTVGGAVWCWGDGGRGGFFSGESHFNYGPRPTLVDSGHAFVSIVAGDTHFCARTAAGVIWCWGAYSFTLGRDPSALPTTTPAPVAGGRTWVAMAAADAGMLAIDDAGHIWRWGWTYDRESRLDAPPEQLTFDSTVFTSVSAGYEHHCAIDSDGRAWCRGHGDVGQIGDSSYAGTAFSFRPTTTDARFKQVTIGDHWTCALSLDDALFCWGSPPGPSGGFMRSPYPMGLLAGIGQLTSTWDAFLLNRRGVVNVFNDPYFNAGGINFAGAIRGAEAALPILGVTKMAARAPTACMIRVDRRVLCVGEVPGFGPAPVPVGIPAP